MAELNKNINNIIEERVLDIFEGTLRFSLLALALSKKFELNSDMETVFFDKEIIDVANKISSEVIEDCFKEMGFLVERIIREADEIQNSSFH